MVVSLKADDQVELTRKGAVAKEAFQVPKSPCEKVA